MKRNAGRDAKIVARSRVVSYRKLAEEFGVTINVIRGVMFRNTRPTYAKDWNRRRQDGWDKIRYAGAPR